jgi:hypothetical protein
MELRRYVKKELRIYQVDKEQELILLELFIKMQIFIFLMILYLH